MSGVVVYLRPRVRRIAKRIGELYVKLDVAEQHADEHGPGAEKSTNCATLRIEIKRTLAEFDEERLRP